MSTWIYQVERERTGGVWCRSEICKSLAVVDAGAAASTGSFSPWHVGRTNDGHSCSSKVPCSLMWPLGLPLFRVWSYTPLAAKKRKRKGSCSVTLIRSSRPSSGQIDAWSLARLAWSLCVSHKKVSSASRTSWVWKATLLGEAIYTLAHRIFGRMLTRWQVSKASFDFRGSWRKRLESGRCSRRMESADRFSRMGQVTIKTSASRNFADSNRQLHTT